jgi:hypothetical protein
MIDKERKTILQKYRDHWADQAIAFEIDRNFYNTLEAETPGAVAQVSIEPSAINGVPVRREVRAAEKAVESEVGRKRAVIFVQIIDKMLAQ